MYHELIAQSVQVNENMFNIQIVMVPLVKVRKHIPKGGSGA